MTRVGRWWLGAVLCVLGFSAASAQAVEPKYLPSDTEIVFSINFKQIKEADLVKKNKDAIDTAKAMLQQALPGDNPAAKYLKAMGFDPFKDLNVITVAMGATANPQAGFLLIDGNFDPDKFHQTTDDAARDNGEVIKVTKVGNNRLIEITPPGGENTLFVSLTGKNALIVAGSKEGLTDAVARVTGARKNNLRKEVRALLETTNSKQSVSFVATGSAITKLMEDKLKEEGAIPEQQRKQVEAAIKLIKNIEGFSGAITLAKDVQFLVGVNSKDADTAKNLAKQAQQALAGLQFILQLQAQNNGQLAPVMDIVKTLKITSQGSNLVIQGQVTPEVIATLLKNLPGQQ